MYKTIIAVVVFLFVALAVQLYDQERIQARIERQQQEATQNQQPATSASRKLTPAEDRFVPELFSVPGGPPKEFTITVGSQMTEAAIIGHFAVSNPTNGRVEVYVFDEDDYDNWRDGNNSTAIFSSGRESMGDVHARLGKSGRYYLIFRNSTSSKAVDMKADIKLQYEKVTTPS